LPNICPNCGKPLQDENAEICPGCGVRLKPLITRKGLLIFWLVFALLVIALLAILYIIHTHPVYEEHWGTRAVSARVRQVGFNIVVTWEGGSDNQMVSNYTIVVYTGNSSPINTTVNVPNNSVGFSSTLPGYGTPYNDHTVVIGTFTDGSHQVVLDAYV